MHNENAMRSRYYKRTKDEKRVVYYVGCSYDGMTANTFEHLTRTAARRNAAGHAKLQPRQFTASTYAGDPGIPSSK